LTLIVKRAFYVQSYLLCICADYKVDGSVWFLLADGLLPPNDGLLPPNDGLLPPNDGLLPPNETARRSADE